MGHNDGTVAIDSVPLKPAIHFLSAATDQSISSNAAGIRALGLSFTLPMLNPPRNILVRRVTRSIHVAGGEPVEMDSNPIL
jgi:hypothetical protein